MDFSFTEEQTLLRDTVASYLADHYDFEKRRAAVKSASGWRPEVWKAFAEELGILGASFAEELGGLGGGATENMVIMEEFGKALVVEPYLGTVVIGGGFLKHGKPAGGDELAGKIIAGEATVAFAYAEPQARYNLADLKTTARKDGGGWVLNGAKAVVIGAPWASHLIVTARTGGAQRDAGGVSVFLVEKSAKGVTTRDYPTVDGQRASEVTFENVSLPASALIGGEGAGLPLVETVVDEAIAATCAEACGVLRKLHEGTLEYTKQRKQFGQPIAQFQAIKHAIARMGTEIEPSRGMWWVAAHALDRGHADASRQASIAKAHVTDRAMETARQSVELHGGYGFTWECEVQMWFKRIMFDRSALGTPEQHRERQARLGGW